MNANTTINDALNDSLKPKRGRPKGSKNKPKPEEILSLHHKHLNESSSRRKAMKTSDYLFAIKPKQGGKCYYQTEVTVDYTPNQEFGQEKSIIPRLNCDNLPYIPGFIMQIDETYYQKHDQRYKEEHQNKIKDYTMAKRGLYQPKPGKRHNYCCVCKQSYEDYLSHVLSSGHKKAYNSNEFAKYIKTMSGSQNQWSRQQQIKDDLFEYYPETQTNVDNQDDCQIIPADSSHTQKCRVLKEKMNYEKQQELLMNNRVGAGPQQPLLSNFMSTNNNTSTANILGSVNMSNNNATAQLYRQNYLDMTAAAAPLRQQSSLTQLQNQQSSQGQTLPPPPQLFMTQKQGSINTSTTTTATTQHLLPTFHFDGQQFTQPSILAHSSHCIGYPTNAIHATAAPTATATMFIPTANPAYFMNMAAITQLSNHSAVLSQQQQQLQQQQQQQQQIQQQKHLNDSQQENNQDGGYKKNISSGINSLTGKRSAAQAALSIQDTGFYSKWIENPTKSRWGSGQEKIIDLTEDRVCIPTTGTTALGGISDESKLMMKSHYDTSAVQPQYQHDNSTKAMHRSNSNKLLTMNNPFLRGNSNPLML